MAGPEVLPEYGRPWSPEGSSQNPGRARRCQPTRPVARDRSTNRSAPAPHSSELLRPFTSATTDLGKREAPAGRGFGSCRGCRLPTHCPACPARWLRFPQPELSSSGGTCRGGRRLRVVRGKCARRARPGSWSPRGVDRLAALGEELIFGGPAASRPHDDRTGLNDGAGHIGGPLVARYCRPRPG